MDVILFLHHKKKRNSCGWQWLGVPRCHPASALSPSGLQDTLIPVNPVSPAAGGSKSPPGPSAPLRVPPTAPQWVGTGAKGAWVTKDKATPKGPCQTRCQSSTGWAGQFGDVPKEISFFFFFLIEECHPKAALERSLCPSLHHYHLVLSPACQTSPGPAHHGQGQPGWALEEPQVVTRGGT